MTRKLHVEGTVMRTRQEIRLTSLHGVRYKEDMRLTDRPCSQEPIADPALIEYSSIGSFHRARKHAEFEFAQHRICSNRLTVSPSQYNFLSL